MLCVMLGGANRLTAADFNTTYAYTANTPEGWTLTNFTDSKSYYLIPASEDFSVATISGIFDGKTITSSVVVTLNVATYSTGTNPSASTFSLYADSDCTSALTATQGGTLPTTGKTYTDVTYTVSQADANSLTSDLAIKITKPGKQIRLKSISVKFSYQEEGGEVNSAPEFTTHPTSAIYEINDSPSDLTVEASGYPAPTLQWYSNTTESNENGTILQGETNSTYTPSTKTPGTVYYYCVATNSEGEAVSNVAAITVKPPFAGKTLEMSASDEAQIKFETGASSASGTVWSTANPNTYDGITLSGKVTSGSNYTYFDGAVVRFYTNNNLIITPSAGVTIEKVEIIRNTSTSSNGGTINCTGLTASKDNTTTNTNVFTGTATSAVTFTATAQARFTSIKVYYTGESSELNVPSFTLAEGTYFGTQTVKVADYDEALIYYYTTDGTDPTVDGNFDPTGSTQKYDDATGITISATTTVKMIACDKEKISPVKTATYTITTPDATDIMALRAMGAGTYNVTLNDAVVTYVNNKNAYIQDATGGLLIYATHNLKAGDKINGQVGVVLVDYNGTDEATTFDVSKATVTHDNAIPVTNVSLADLLAEGGMKKYESMRVCVSGIQVVTPIESRNGMISQDGNEIAVREGVTNCLSNTCLMTENAMANVYGYPTTYNTTSQLTLWNASAVEEITTITVSTAGYATYYNSAKAYTLPAGCEGYVFYEGKLGSAYNAGDAVPANEPLVIKAEAGTYVLNFTTTEEESWKSVGKNDLEGTDEETVLPADDTYYFYGLSLNSVGELNSVGFYWMNDEGAPFTNGAHKAYLKLAKNNGAGNKAFVFGDEETAIKSVEAENASEAIYDLSGRRVSKALKGLYIINGKKVVK